MSHRKNPIPTPVSHVAETARCLAPDLLGMGEYRTGPRAGLTDSWTMPATWTPGSTPWG